MTAEESGVGFNLRVCPNCSAVFAVRRTGGAPQLYCTVACRKDAEKTRLGGPSRPGRGKRRPLAEFANSAGWSLRKNVERLERIIADDRFAYNKVQVAAALRGHLKYAAEVCQDLLSQLDKIGD